MHFHSIESKLVDEVMGLASTSPGVWEFGVECIIEGNQYYLDQYNENGAGTPGTVNLHITGLRDPALTERPLPRIPAEIVGYEVAFHEIAESTANLASLFISSTDRETVVDLARSALRIAIDKGITVGRDNLANLALGRSLEVAYLDLEDNSAI